MWMPLNYFREDLTLIYQEGSNSNIVRVYHFPSNLEAGSLSNLGELIWDRDRDELDIMEKKEEDLTIDEIGEKIKRIKKSEQQNQEESQNEPIQVIGGRGHTERLGGRIEPHRWIPEDATTQEEASQAMREHFRELEHEYLRNLHIHGDGPENQ
jgi:hypothetical protein